MKIERVAQRVLSITAIAWAIPFAQAQDTQAPEVISAKFLRLDANRDGVLSKDELKRIEGHEKFFAESDDNRDGRLDSSEFIKFQSLQERAYVKRVAEDSAVTAKVKTALLRESQLRSLDVHVETYHGRVLLSGFVEDEAQRNKAMQVASAVSGVARVKNALEVR